jgi:Divergent InlB B-repeat domain
VNIVSPQTSPDGRRQFTFAAWSDGGAQSHAVNGSPTPADSVVAQLNAKYQVKVAIVGGGTVQADTNVDLVNGAFIPSGRVVTLTVTPPPSASFNAWSGDTVTSNPTLALPMGRPYSVTATFAGPLTAGAAPPDGVMGKPYGFLLSASGGAGGYQWSSTGTLPPGVSLAVNGQLQGTPTQAGTFNSVLKVQSGAQSTTLNAAITITEPTLAVANVVGQILGTSFNLTSDDIKYLDLLGNNDGGFDVGDFLAWANKTNATPTKAQLDAVLKAVGRSDR